MKKQAQNAEKMVTHIHINQCGRKFWKFY